MGDILDLGGQKDDPVEGIGCMGNTNGLQCFHRRPISFPLSAAYLRLSARVNQQKNVNRNEKLM